MMFVEQYRAWKKELTSAIKEALRGPVKDGLERAIEQEAKTNVYDAYASSGYRRGQIGAKTNLKAKVSGTTLTITNVTQPQGSGAGMTETSFVESGAPNYRQPFPRPFMNEALEKYQAGEFSQDLGNALRSRGFTVL